MQLFCNYFAITDIILIQNSIIIHFLYLCGLLEKVTKLHKNEQTNFYTAYNLDERKFLTSVKIDKEILDVPGYLVNAKELLLNKKGYLFKYHLYEDRMEPIICIENSIPENHRVVDVIQLSEQSYLLRVSSKDTACHRVFIYTIDE